MSDHQSVISTTIFSQKSSFLCFGGGKIGLLKKGVSTIIVRMVIIATDSHRASKLVS